MDKRRKKKAPADRAAQRSDRGGKAGVLKKALHKSRGKRREKPARARKTERKAAGKKRWPKFAAALCVLGFLLFALPLPAGIADISNLSAMVVFALLAVVFLCWDGFVRALRRLWKRSWGKILLLLSGIGAAAVLLLLLVTSILVMGKMKARPGPEAGTVIVLGCQVRGQTPSLLLSYRIRAAADYLNEHPETKVIVSGGQGSGENISEAECMRRALIARGVAEDRILLEDRSRTTLENIRFSKAILDREGLPEPAVIVSNDFHVYRAVRMAEDLGLPAQGLAARSHWYSKPTYILREAMALVYYFLTG